ncbi:MAG: hypothetical protein V1711_00940 [bacterium]
MKYILLLNRKGKEEAFHRFDASDKEEANEKSKSLIMKEWRERQQEFPFTPEPPPDAILFCEVWAVTEKELRQVEHQESLSKV